MIEYAHTLSYSSREKIIPLAIAELENLAIESSKGVKVPLWLL